MATDSDPLVRRKAAEIMGKLPHKFKPSIVANQSNNNNNEMLLIIMRELIKVLVTMSSDSNSLVRKEVANSLGDFGQCFPHLREDLLESMFSVDEENPPKAFSFGNY